METVIFTDLDGTLLDENYSYEKAVPALKLVKKKNIPVIICTSKTGKETEEYRKKIGNEDPFIVEGGAAIVIPKEYFGFKFIPQPFDSVLSSIDYKISRYCQDHCNNCLRRLCIEFLLTIKK